MQDIKKWGYHVRQGAQLYWSKGTKLIEVIFVAHIPPYANVGDSLDFYQCKDSHTFDPKDWSQKTRCIVKFDGKLEIVPENKLFDKIILHNKNLVDNKWIKESARLSKIIVDNEDKSGKDGVDSKGRIVSRDWLIWEAKLRCEYFSECHDCVLGKDVFCGNAYRYAKRNCLSAW